MPNEARKEKPPPVAVGPAVYKLTPTIDCLLYALYAYMFCCILLLVVLQQVWLYCFVCVRVFLGLAQVLVLVYMVL